MVAILFVAACLQSHIDRWTNIPKFGPNDALSEYVAAAKLSEPYWPSGGSKVYKVASSKVATKILVLIEAGNRKRAFDARPPSVSLLYAYLAPLKSLLRFGLFQADQDFRDQHRAAGVRWLTSLGVFARNNVKKDTINYYVAFAMRRVWAKGVSDDREFLTAKERRNFARQVKSIKDSPSELAAAIRTDYRAYLAVANEQAKNWRAFGEDETEAKAMTDFLNHFPAGREAVRKAIAEFLEAQARGFGRPESEWETPMEPETATDTALFVELGRSSPPESRKYFVGMFKWMSTIDRLELGVGPSHLGSMVLAERKKLLAIADDLEH